MIARCRGVLAPGTCKVSSALLALFARGAERRKTQGLARPLEPLRTARHACEACLGPLAIGDPRLSALHHGVRETLPHYLGPSFAARSLPATGGPAGSLRTGHSAHRAVSEASRESGRLSRTRRHTVPASAKQEPSGMAPLNKQDENIYRTEFKPVNPAPGGDGRERRDGGKMSARHSDGRMGRLETSAQNKTARNDLRS
jgi:hypothetical protein